MTQMYKSEIVRGRDLRGKVIKRETAAGGGEEEERGLSECLAPR